jgi:hypothetical protein
MEARVGIGPIFPLLRSKYALFYEVFKVKRKNPFGIL